MSFKTGDWVRSYSKGIWQIARQVPEHFETRFSLKSPKALCDVSRFILKRLVNEKWKPAFAVESADVAFLKPLTKADSARLERFLRDNPEVLDQFEQFDKPLDCILNLSFSLPKKSDFAKFKRHFEASCAQPLEKGMTSDTILKIIAQSEFADGFHTNPKSATLQFICQNHEIKRREMIYRQMNVLNF